MDIHVEISERKGSAHGVHICQARHTSPPTILRSLVFSSCPPPTNNWPSLSHLHANLHTIHTVALFQPSPLISWQTYILDDKHNAILYFLPYRSLCIWRCLSVEPTYCITYRLHIWSRYVHDMRSHERYTNVHQWSMTSWVNFFVGHKTYSTITGNKSSVCAAKSLNVTLIHIVLILNLTTMSNVKYVYVMFAITFLW